jgi:hypothetical protein
MRVNPNGIATACEEKESFGSNTTSFWMCSTSLESLRDGERRSEQQRIERRSGRWCEEGGGVRKEERRTAEGLRLGAITHSGSGCTANTVHWVVTGA